MMTTAPLGHVHEDFSTGNDEVKPAPVEKRKLLHYIGRSLRACLLVLLSSHSLILSRCKHDNGGHTLSLCSPLVTDPAGSKVRRCNVHSFILGDGSDPQPTRLDQHALLFSPTQYQLWRASHPFFLAAVRSAGRSGLP